MESNLRTILDLVYNRGRRVSSRKQSQIGQEINNCRRWAKDFTGTITEQQALNAARQVANHKGRWDDSLRNPIQIVAYYLVSIGK